MTSWVDVAGWTLIHFVWQGAAIAASAAIALRLLHSARPQLRYAVGCAALIVMLAAPIGTAFVLSGGATRAPLVGSSIHLLRAPQGAVLGVAIIPSVTPGPGAAAPPAPIEVRLPFRIDTETLMPTVVTLWLAGIVLLLARLTVAGWRVRRLVAMSRRQPLSRWQHTAETIAARLHVRARFSVVDSVRVGAPMVVGWLRPVVLLPFGAMAGLSAAQTEAILAHELAHIRRHDFLVNLLQTVAEIVLFYHPAVWWVSRRIRIEREHCCDDVAVAVCGNATEYATALTELASWSLSHPPLAMAVARGPLSTRIRRLLNLSQPPDHSRGRNLVLLSAVIAAVTIVGALGVMLKAQPLSADPGGVFGPAEVNQVLGYELFPGPVRLPTDDPAGVRSWGVQVTGDGGEMAFIGFSARGLIRLAYDLGTMPIADAPRWMDEETFDITVPADVEITNGLPHTEDVHRALRQYLEGTLGLTTHRARREFPAYALVRARPDGVLGPNIKPSAAECVAGPPSVGGNPPRLTEGRLQARSEVDSDGSNRVPVHVTRRFCGVDSHLFGLRGTRVTMPELAVEFYRTRYPLAPGREIVDRTGLTGEYDFELRFGLLPLAAIGYANPTIGAVLHPFGLRNLFTALPEQLGLTLIDARVTRDVLVIDRIERPGR